jgi:hypothetical protein
MSYPNDEPGARKAKGLFIVVLRCQPHSFPGDCSLTVQRSPGFSRLGNRVRFSQKLYLRDQRTKPASQPPARAVPRTSAARGELPIDN